MSLLSPGLRGDQGKQNLKGFPEMPAFALLAELILHLRHEGFPSCLQSRHLVSKKPTRTLDIPEISQMER